jgi:hypothetical protein
MERGSKKRERERERESDRDGSVVGHSLEMYHKHCRFRASFEYIYLCT